MLWRLSALFLFSCNSLFLYIVAPSWKSHFDADSYVYHFWGTYFAQSGSFFDPTYQRIAMQPIGYHSFVGFLYSLGFHDYRVILVAQYIVALCSLVLTYHIAYRIAGRIVARMSIILLSFNVGFIVYSQLILAEMLLLFLVFLFVLSMLYWLEENRMRYLCSASFILWIATVVKPFGLIFIYPYLCLVGWYTPWPFTKKMKNVSIAAICFGVPLFFYFVRNYLVYGTWMFAPMMGVNMCQFLCKIKAAASGFNYDDLLSNHMPSEKLFFDPAVWRAVRADLFESIQGHPFIAAYVWSINVAKTVCGLFFSQLKLYLNPDLLGNHVSYFSDLSTGIIGYISYGLTNSNYMLIALYELIMQASRIVLLPYAFFSLKAERHTVFFVLFIGTMMLITGTDGCARYRMPIEPLLIIFQAVGLRALWSRYGEKLYNALIPAARSLQ